MNKNELKIFVPHSEKLDSSLAVSAERDTLDSWREVAALVESSEVRKRAEEFVKRCERMGAFRTDPGCEVDLLDDNRVMFDWNNGKIPILTAMVSEETVTFVAKFADGKAAGDDSTSTMLTLRAVLSRLVEEIGDLAWQNMQTIPSATGMRDVWENWLVSLSRVTSGKEVDERPSSFLRRTARFQSTQQTAVSRVRTSRKQAYMLPN